MKYLKRIISLLLVVLLGIAICACTNPAATTKATTTATTAGTSASTTTKETEPETVTLTCGFSVNDTTLGDGTHQEYRLLEEVTKQTGVILDFITYDQEKFKVLAAGNDLPDIFNIQGADYTTAASIISAGQCMVLDDLLAQYGSNILAKAPEAMTYAKGFAGDGKTYFMPIYVTRTDLTNPNFNAMYCFGFRYDLYEAVGTPRIDNWESWVDALKLMQDYERDRTGADDIYGLSDWVDWGLWPFKNMVCMAYGVTGNDGGDINTDYPYVTSQYLDKTNYYWYGIYLRNYAYRMGAYDPDGLIQGFGQYMDKLYSGKMLSVSGLAFVNNKNMSQAGENAIMTIIPGLPTYGIYPTDGLIGWSSIGARVINANCEYPEIAMKFYNWCDSDDGTRTLVNGVKGVDWDYVNGEPGFIGNKLTAIKDGKQAEYEDSTKSGVAGTSFVGLKTDCTSGYQFRGTDGYFLDFMNLDEIKALQTTSVQLAFCKKFNDQFTYPGQVYDFWYKTGVIPYTQLQGSDLFTFKAGQSADMASVWSQCEQYVTANLGSFVNAETEDEYNAAVDKAIDDMEAMGAVAAYEDYLVKCKEAADAHDIDWTYWKYTPNN